MPTRSKYVIYPNMQKRLQKMGKQIRNARLRRRLPVALVAERAGISRTTLNAVEKGSPSVAMGIYANVLGAIGLASDLEKIAADDEMGRALQDMELPKRVRRRESDT